MCDTTVDSSHSLGYTWSIHTIKSRRFSDGICTSNRNFILRYMTRPSHGGHAVGVRGFQDGRRIPREVATYQRGSDPPAPSAALNNIRYPELIPLIASGHTPPAGAPESKIIVTSMCVARA